MICQNQPGAERRHLINLSFLFFVSFIVPVRAFLTEWTDVSDNVLLYIFHLIVSALVTFNQSTFELRWLMTFSLSLFDQFCLDIIIMKLKPEKDSRSLRLLCWCRRWFLTLTDHWNSWQQQWVLVISWHEPLSKLELIKESARGMSRGHCTL